MAMMKKKKTSIPRLKWVTYTTFVPSEGGSTQEPFLMDKEAVFVRCSDLLCSCTDG